MKTGSSESASGYLTALFRGGTLSSKSDSELLELFIAPRSGQDESAELAFSALLARHGAMVLRVCRTSLGDEQQAEDAFQATFLILASRAWSIRRHVSIASWLYGVALRVAGTEGWRAARRNRHERRHAEMTARAIEEPNESGLGDAEAVRVLHQEIGLLPERYRSAVILCYLQGLTHETAAERLGRPVGTVRSRLATARDRLRARLTRRGLAPAIIPALTFADATSTSIPSALAEATVNASINALLGKMAIAGVATPEAILLTKATIKQMLIIRWSFRLALYAVTGFVALGAGAIAYSALPREEVSPIGRLGDAGALVQEPTSAGKSTGQAPSRAPDSNRTQEQGGAADGPKIRPAPIVIEAETVNAQGTHIPGVFIGLSVSYTPRRAPEVSRVLQTVSDDEGRGRLQEPPSGPGERARSATVWAYKAGRSLARAAISISEKSQTFQVRLILEEAVSRTISVVGANGRPIQGVRMTPRLLQRANTRSPLSLPSDLDEQFIVAFDANGTVAIPYLSRDMKILTVCVDGPGIARHTLPLQEQQGNDNYLLELGSPGRLVGFVCNESGQPLHDVPLEVWVRAAGTTPSDLGMIRARRNATPTAAVTFTSEPPRSGPDGAFQTPMELLSGSTYRESIRRDGFAPFVSDWVTIEGDRTAIPPIRLKALRKLAGSVRDRQRQPVAQARVFLASHGPATTTDAQGRFQLAGVLPEKSVLLAHQVGFRFQGWAIDPLATGDELSLTLARTSEPPEQVISPQADQNSASDLKALANRLLELCLRAVMTRDNDRAKLLPLDYLSEFAPGRVREILENGRIKDPRIVAQLRGELAVKMATTDPVDAKAEATAISDPQLRSHFLVRLAAALPESEPAQKRALLSEAIVQARAMPELPIKVIVLRQIIKGLLDLGAIELAMPLIQEGLKILDSRPSFRALLAGGFLAQVARVDPAQAHARIQKLSDQTDRDDVYREASVEMALSRPADAERFFGLIDQRSGIQMYGTALRLCRRLAEVDLPRAQRIAAAIETPGARACAWAFTALGSSKRGKQTDPTALDRALEAIDRVLESGPGPEPVTNLDGVLTLYPTNPAAVILPVVEEVAPERLAEFFWRAVALHERFDIDKEDSLQRSAIGVECLILSRYDRQIAALLFEPMDLFIKSVRASGAQANELTASVIVAKACLDPRAAVEFLEWLPVARDELPSSEARMRLAHAFSVSAKDRWKVLWRSMQAQVPLED